MTPPGQGTDAGMRVATFNILNGRSPVDDRVDERRFADAVSRLDADVLALQEVDRNQPRSQHADLTAIAAEAMGAREHRFVAALSGTPGTTWSAATGREQPDAAAYGVALLSRYPVLGWQEIRLAPVPVPVPYRFHGQVRPEWVRDEPRVAVLAEVDAPGGRLGVVTTHLSFLRWWNGRQLHHLVRALADHTGPMLLTGDLNMTPPRASRLTRMQPVATAPTFPADSPTEQIDHILARGGVTARDGGAVELPMSDHRALVAELP